MRRGGLLLFSGADDGSIIMWDSEEGTQLGSFSIRQDSPSQQSLLLSRGYSPPAIRFLATVPSAELLISIATDGTMLLWDIPSRTVRRHYKQHNDELRCLSLRSAAAQLVLGTESGALEVFPLGDLSIPLPEPEPEAATAREWLGRLGYLSDTQIESAVSGYLVQEGNKTEPVPAVLKALDDEDFADLVDELRLGENESDFRAAVGALG